jgi:hypothetical protein
MFDSSEGRHLLQYSTSLKRVTAPTSSDLALFRFNERCSFFDQENYGGHSLGKCIIKVAAAWPFPSLIE